jgi:hypothetical protein
MRDRLAIWSVVRIDPQDYPRALRRSMPRAEASRLATRCNRQRSPDASHRYAVRRDSPSYL